MKIFEVVSPGINTTIQDLGRYSYRYYGISLSGACDKEALRNANEILGNHINSAAIEITSSNVVFKTINDVSFSLTGAKAICEVDEVPVENYKIVCAKKGDLVHIKKLDKGSRLYLSIEGGLIAKEYYGSKSVYKKLGFGKELKRGDVLESFTERINKPIKVKCPHKYEDVLNLRVTLGPDLYKFSKETIKLFLKENFTITNNWDSQGMRLSGEKILHIDDGDVLSHPVVHGCIQIPGDNQPIILMANTQTTGGYPVIATVIEEDLGKLAQAIPNNIIKFKQYK